MYKCKNKLCFSDVGDMVSKIFFDKLQKMEDKDLEKDEITISLDFALTMSMKRGDKNKKLAGPKQHTVYKMCGHCKPL